MILYDSGVIRDDVTSVRAFASGEWAGTTALNTINSHLKPEYQAVFMNIDSTTVIQPGDILIVTAAQRGKKSGHVALAVPENGKTYTVEIGSSDYTRPLKVYYGRSEAARNYYRHLIRIVEKQSTTT
jgi:pantothenate kinase-related protein Tda10